MLNTFSYIDVRGLLLSLAEWKKTPYLLAAVYLDWLGLLTGCTERRTMCARCNSTDTTTLQKEL